MKVKSESEVAQSYPTLSNPWTAAYQAPPSMGLSRQEYWSGVPLPSKYAYLTLHAYAAIWKERQFKMATGEPIKHFREIERLFTAIHRPKEVAFMHGKGHSREGSKAA